MGWQRRPKTSYRSLHGFTLSPPSRIGRGDGTGGAGLLRREESCVGKKAPTLGGIVRQKGGAEGEIVEGGGGSAAPNTSFRSLHGCKLAPPSRIGRGNGAGVGLLRRAGKKVPAQGGTVSGRRRRRRWETRGSEREGRRRRRAWGMGLGHFFSVCTRPPSRGLCAPDFPGTDLVIATYLAKRLWTPLPSP